jgi:hypothetical protein
LVIPIRPLVEETPEQLDDDTLQQIISRDARKLSESLEDLDILRDYYENDQDLNFASDEFRVRRHLR